MRAILISAGLFLLLAGGSALAGFLYLIEPGPEGRVRYVATLGKLLLHKYALVDELSPAEGKLLYKMTCTRKCHSRDVIELTTRTAREWEWIVSRMGVSERADLSESEAATIVEYLQLNFLSNIPTILSEKTMRFLKRHLWRMDFGDSDIYFDVIFIPRVHRSLMPFLAFRSSPRVDDDLLFIVYVNTHSGAVPPWDLSALASLVDDQGRVVKAKAWEVLYEDGQQHHRQGILTFPGATLTDAKLEGSMEMEIRPPGMRKRSYHWRLPIPDVGGLPSKLGAKVAN